MAIKIDGTRTRLSLNTLCPSLGSCCQSLGSCCPFLLNWTKLLIWWEGEVTQAPQWGGIHGLNCRAVYMGVWWSQPWLISLYFFQRGQIPSNTSSDSWLISLHFVKRGKIPVTPPLILGNPPMPLRVPSEGGSMAIPHCKRSHLYSPMAYNILINGYGYIIRL